MKKYWGLILIFFLSLGAILPLLHPGFFPMHDNTQVVRVQQMAQALRDQQIPVRWVGDLGYGYGYPLFNFYAPLAYYFGAFFNLLGFDALLATKLMFITGILLAGFSMYLLAREFWGEMGGVISGLFYLYAPYHALDIYVRGAVGEFWAMAFLPFLFLGLYQFSQKGKTKWVIVSVLAYAAVILSHNLSAMMITPLVFLIILLINFLRPGKKSLQKSLLFFLLALGLTAFYWLPALTEMKFTQVLGQIGGGADWRDHFVFLDQLWASPWGFAGSAPGRLDGMSFMIGKLHLLFGVLALITAAWLWWKKEKKLALIILVAFGFFLLAVFLINQLSSFLWQTIPLMAFIQYPWRFLFLATLAISFSAGSLLLWFREKSQWLYLVGGLSLFFLLLFNLKYFQPQKYLKVSAGDYLTEEAIKWEASKISDEYLPRDFPVPESRDEVAWNKVAVIKGEAEIGDLEVKSQEVRFQVKAGEGTTLLINIAFFPGWRVWLDGQETDFRLSGGKIELTPPPGEHQILVRLINTPIRALADLLSLISFIWLLGLICLNLC
jgi:hypothetical protein